MNTKPKQLIIAVVIGIVALFVNKWFIDSKLDEVRPRDNISVMVAKRVIPAGTPLSRSMFDLKSVPKNFAPKSVITGEAFSSTEGQEAVSTILAGDYLMEASIGAGGVEGGVLSQQLTGDNSRAITIPVDEPNSLSRSIVTGDRIDIIFTFAVPVLNQQMSTLLFQNIPIIATGSYSVAEEQQGGRGPKVRNYGTITLKLSAQEALRLNYARQAGKINIILRNGADNAVIDLPAVAGIMDLLSAADKQAIDRMLKLPGMQGGDGEKMKEQIREMMELQRKQQGRPPAPEPTR